jgi:hypothetical protein
VRLLVEEDVLPRIGAEMLHDLNTFRKRYCYPKVVDQVIKWVVSEFPSQGSVSRN